MVKSFAARKGKGRKPRRRTNRRRHIAPQSPFPPIIPFDRMYMNVVLRQVIQYPDQPINASLEGFVSVRNMFDGVWVKMRDIFSQMWVVKIHVYVMAGVGFEEPGYHLINVAPQDEFKITAKTSFTTLAGLPGTRTSRITRMVSGVWYPTGMDERKWYSIKDDAVLADYVYKSSCQKSGGTASSTYPVDVTIDCHVKLRGVSYTRLQRSVEEDGLDAEFVNLAT